MGWFDEQNRERKLKDDESFSEAFKELAGAVMGKHLTKALSDVAAAQSAIDEILRYYNIKDKYSEIPATAKDFDEQIDYRLRPHGILHRPVILDKGWYRVAVGPMLGSFVSDGRAVALIPRRFGGYSYMDPESGELIKITKKNEGLFEDEAEAFFKPFPLKKIGIKELLAYMFSAVTPGDIVMFLVSMGIVTLVGLLTPVLNNLLLGTVLESGSGSVLIAIAVFMITASLSSMLFSAVRSISSERISIKQDSAVRSAAMMRMLSLPTSFFKDYSSGELARRVEYISTLCRTIMDGILGAGITSVFSFVYIGSIFAYAPGLVVPSLLIILVTVVFSVISAVARKATTTKEMQLSAAESGMTYSMINGIQKIRLAGAEKRAFARWAHLYSENAKLTYDPPVFIKLNGVIATAISLAGTLIMYYMAAETGVSVSEYYAFNSAYGMVSGAFYGLAGIMTTVSAIKPNYDLAKPILQAEPEISDGKTVVTTLRGGVELNNVTFRYNESMPYVLDDLTLKIRPGQYVAICGSTGCGKSTLMRMLLGFEKPQKGAIYYDGKDLAKLELSSLRRKIGTVLQDGKLFAGDIYSNIVITAPWLTLDEAWEAAEMAGIADDIRDMPMGMNTLISEGSGGISGGQRQRLLIARAVASKPKILMFDEATSALDNITQKHVSEAVDKLKCTRIVIAHRLSTIRHCDRIIVLDHGKIVEDGSYEQLIAQNGFFAELVSRQRLDS